MNTYDLGGVIANIALVVIPVAIGFHIARKNKAKLKEEKTK